MKVLRRFPTYDFTFEMAVSVPDASSRLESFLAHQERPHGFVLSDPRVDGTVNGATFTFRRREATLSGSVVPYVEGYFVPSERGSSVFVRVQIPAWWWLFDAIILILVCSDFLWPPTMEGLLIGGLLVTFIQVLTVGPCWYEGHEAEALLRKVFGLKAAA